VLLRLWSSPAETLNETAKGEGSPVPENMEGRICSVVSPHLLDALAASDDPETRKMALRTLAHTSDVRVRRKRHFDAKIAAHERIVQFPVLQGIVADQILKQVVSFDRADATSRELPQQTLVIKQSLQGGLLASPGTAKTIPKLKLNRQIYDMENFVNTQGGVDITCFSLPGKLVRSEGEASIADEAANEAYDNCAKVLEFYHQVFGYTFLDDRDAPIISSVHYRDGYQNAQWVGENVRQMIYGDGGPELRGFTACLDIIGHEMTVSTVGWRNCGASFKLTRRLACGYGALVPPSIRRRIRRAERAPL